MMPQATQAERQTMLDMKAKGHSWAEIGQHFGRSGESVRKLVRLVAQPATMPVAEVKQASQEMEIAALQERLRQLGAGPASRVPVEPHYQESTDWGDVWQRHEAETSRRIAAFHRLHDFDLSLDDDRPVGIAFISDQHIGGNKTDLKRMRADAELIAQTDGLYAILGGDSIENHIKHRATIVNTHSTPSDQYHLLNYYLGIFAHRIAALISGNHDDWTVAFAGVDVIQRIAQQQRICFAPNEAFLNLTLGKQKYTIAIRHQYRFNSSYNNTHSMKQWWRFGTRPYDIGCVCHLHEAAMEPFKAHGLWRYAFRPGSYKISDSYSEALGYNATEPLCPTAVLYPNERRIVPFLDVRDAVEYLKSVRK